VSSPGPPGGIDDDGLGITGPPLTEDGGPPNVPRNALKWSFVMTWGRRGFATVFLVLLAAILGPEAYGVVTLAAVYILLLELFVEQGISTALVQRETLDDEHLDTAFWMNLAWAVLFAGVSIALAGFWARANGTPQLEPIIDVLSITIILDALTLVQQAQLQREMAFKKLAMRTNVATVISGIVGVSLALTGAGAWALVAQQLTYAAASTVLFVAIVRWYPKLRFSLHHARELLGFSVDVFFANLAGFLSRRGDILFMGLFFSPVVVGTYRLADRLVDTVLELCVRPVSVISLPHFSRLQQDPARLRRSVAACMRLTILLAVPTMLAMAGCSKYILGVLGSKWSAGVTALELLAIVGVVKALIVFTGPLLFALAKARIRAAMLWAQAALSVAVVVVAGLVFGGVSVEQQLTGVAGLRALLFVLVFVPLNVAIVTRLTGLRVREIASFVPVPLISGAAAIAAVALVTKAGLLDSVRPVPALLIAGSLALAAALGVLIALEQNVRREVLRLLRSRGSIGGSPGQFDPGEVQREA
jgi:O-antigen/teichoic acid export membrane protein